MSVINPEKEEQEKLRREVLYEHLRLKSEMKGMRKSLNYSSPMYDGPGVIPLAKTPLHKISERKSSLNKRYICNCKTLYSFNINHYTKPNNKAALTILDNRVSALSIYKNALPKLPSPHS